MRTTHGLRSSGGADLTAIQLREPREQPDADQVRTFVQRAVADGAAQWQRIESAQRVLLCERPPSSSTGIRSMSENLRAAPSGENGTDLKYALAAEVGNELSDLLEQSFQEGALSGRAMNGPEDAIKGSYAAMELKWYLDGPMEQEVDRVLSECAHWTTHFGSYVVGVDWTRRRVDRDAMIKLADLWDWAAEQGSADFTNGIAAALEQGAQLQPGEEQAIMAEGEALAREAQADLQGMVFEKDRLKELAEVVRLYAPALCEGEPMRIARAFQRGETEMACLIYETVEDRPRLTGLRPGVDVLFPNNTQDIAQAAWVVEPIWGTAADMRLRAASEGWDAAWVNELLTHPGLPCGLWQQYGSQWPWLLSGLDIGMTVPAHLRESEYFCALMLTYRTASKAGGESIYRCAVHDGCEGFAYHRRLDGLTGCLPYRDFRHERHQRTLLAGRGIVEMLEDVQNVAKGNRDAWCDGVQRVVNPTLVIGWSFQGDPRPEMVPGGLLRVKDRERDPAYMVPPNAGGMGLGIEMDRHLRMTSARQFGLMHPEVPSELLLTMWQNRTGSFLRGWSRVFRLVYEQIQLYGPEEVTLRVTDQPRWFAGTGRMPIPQQQLMRAEMRGSYDFVIEWNSKTRDVRLMESHAKVIAAAAQLDTEGRLSRGPLLASLIAPIAPQAAAAILSSEEGAEREIAKCQQDWAVIVSGQEPAPPVGRASRTALAYFEQMVQASPVMQRLLQEEQIAKVFENYLKVHQQNVAQEENRQIGATGGRPVLQPNPAGNGMTASE